MRNEEQQQQQHATHGTSTTTTALLLATTATNDTTPTPVQEEQQKQRGICHNHDFSSKMNFLPPESYLETTSPISRTPLCRLSRPVGSQHHLCTPYQERETYANVH